MKKLLFTLLLLFTTITTCYSYSSYTRYGDTVYGSNGVNYTTYGDTTYGSNGVNYTRYGDTIYSTDGTRYT